MCALRCCTKATKCTFYYVNVLLSVSHARCNRIYRSVHISVICICFMWIILDVCAHMCSIALAKWIWYCNKNGIDGLALYFIFIAICARNMHDVATYTYIHCTRTFLRFGVVCVRIMWRNVQEVTLMCANCNLKMMVRDKYI